MAYHEENILDPYLDPALDRQIVEMCLAEPRLFMEAYLWVENKEDGEVPFRLRTDQLMVYDLIQKLRGEGKPVRLICLKARQVGISTFIEAWIFTMCRLRKSTHALIVAHLKPTAKVVFSMFKLFYDRLPKAIRPEKKSRTENQLIMSGINSSVEIATAKTVDFGRGYPLNLIHATEFAMWPYPEELLDGLLGGISEGPDSFMAIESTAKGMDGEFFDLWGLACDGELKDDQQWVPVFLAWWQHDGYELDVTPQEATTLYAADNLSMTERKLVELWLKDSDEDERYGYTWEQWQRKLKWRRTKIATNFRGRELLFGQEYPDSPDNAFLAHGQTVYNIEAIRYYMMNTMQDGVRGHMSVDGAGNPRFVQGPDMDGEFPMTVWHFPRNNTSYAAGMDAAMGLDNNRKPVQEEMPVQVPTFPGQEHAEQPRVKPLSEKEQEKGADFSAMVVMDINRVQCAEYRKRSINPAAFAEVGALIGKWYGGLEGECLINPEAATGGGNTAGYGMVNRLKKIYHRIDKWEQYDSENKVKLSHSIGWEATVKAMPVFLSETQRELDRGADLLPPEHRGKYDAHWPKMKIHSKRLLAEMTNFQLRSDSGMGAVRNKHDDLVRAWGLAILAFQHMRPPDNTTENRVDARILPFTPNSGLQRRSHAGPMPWANH